MGWRFETSAALPDCIEVAAGAGGEVVRYFAERTCRNVYEGREFECSRCGEVWHLLSMPYPLADWEHVRSPKYCPSCGAAVTGDERKETGDAEG